MLSQWFGKLTATWIQAIGLVSLVFSTSVVSATSFVPYRTTNSTIENELANQKGFIYPSSLLENSDYVETGILFVYNQHILDFFGGDAERLLTYIDASINYNNSAFSSSNIPLKRVVSGLINADEQLVDYLSDDTSYIARLETLAEFQNTANGIKLANDTQYSYLVGLAGFEALEDQSPIVGLSYLSGNVSWISPYTNNELTWSQRTLAHELGHNDGFRHSSEDHQGQEEYLASTQATGYQCGEYASVMHISGDRSEAFFSDPDINLITNQEQHTCGVAGEANSAQVYRDLAASLNEQQQRSINNIVSTRTKSGFVGIYKNESLVAEGQTLSFDVIFSGAEQGDSVNLVVRQGSAGLDDFKSEIMHVSHNGNDNVYRIYVETKSDELSEESESLSIELIYPNGVLIDETATSAQGTIVDADYAIGYVEFLSASQQEVTEGQTLTIKLKRMAGTAGELKVSINAMGIEATNDDFSVSTNEIVFANGQQEADINVTIVNDNIQEELESFELSLSYTIHPAYVEQASSINTTLQANISANDATDNSDSANASSTNTSSTVLGSAQNSQSNTSIEQSASGGSIGFYSLILALFISLRQVTSALKR